MTDTTGAKTGPDEEIDDGTEDGLEIELPDQSDDTLATDDDTGEAERKSGGGEDETGSEPEGRTPLNVRRAGRENDRLRTLSERNAQLEAELAQARASGQAEERRKALEALSPEERKEVEREQRLLGIEFRANDATDRAEYRIKAQSNPIYARYADQVEEALKAVRANGTNMPREAILQYIVGREVVARGPKQRAKQGAAAARRVEAARGKPAAGRGDAGGSSRKQPTLAERLADVRL